MRDIAIATTCRTIACATRLRLMQHLHDEDEATPSELADLLAMTPGTIVTHLQLLQRDGLVIGGSRDARKQYKINREHSRTPFETAVGDWVFKALKAGTKGRALAGTGMGERLEMPARHQHLCAAATVFGQARRIALIHYLADHPGSVASDLVCGTGIPTTTVIYHLDKLLHRGVVRTNIGRGPSNYRLAAKLPNSLHDKLYKIVSTHWEEPKPNTPLAPG